MSNVKKVLEVLKSKVEVNEMELTKLAPAIRTITNQLRNQGHKILRVFDGEKYYFVYKGFSNEYKEQRNKSKTVSKSI